jgi:metalloendopeptidase OMA1, mitochondrial
MLISPAYLLPNDDIESDRLDLQYEALKMLHDDKIYFAPLKDPRRILDIGTGTGIWAIEMGESADQRM